jgi:hypothetical protein
LIRDSLQISKKKLGHTRQCVRILCRAAKTFLQNCRLCRRTIVLKLGWNVLILLLYISGLQHNIKIKNRPLFKHLQINFFWHSSCNDLFWFFPFHLFKTLEYLFFFSSKTECEAFLDKLWGFFDWAYSIYLGFYEFS